MRIESHNHPSAVEPYQGAATGVGGIIRDVFTMGARPIALLDPLRFGPLDDPRSRWTFEGVVRGIAGYGNAVGVPTVGGEVAFDECYLGNPLVNVFCLGVMPTGRLILGRASGAGNLAVLVGASTGRDGIGGVSVLASAGFGGSGGEDDAAKRPSVQVGDPFEEKRLIEACLELLDLGLAVGIQDLGGAGITCAVSETASKGGAGMDVWVSEVVQREPGMTPAEIMTSESQERVLVIVTPADLDAVRAVCARWEVRASVIGAVTGSGRLRVLDRPGGEVLADVPAAALEEDRPLYDRPQRAVAAPALAPPPCVDPGADVLALLADPAWVYRQYDHQLFLNTVTLPGGDAAVLRLKAPGLPPSSRAIAVSADGNAGWCAVDPRLGAALTVAESCLNVACAGARPVALVNCLNFGNPEHPEVMWQLASAVDGLGDACRALGIPVIGGNVSLYNESSGVDIDPTPVVAVLGIIDELERRPPGVTMVDGGTLMLVGGSAAQGGLGGSRWARSHGARGGPLPGLDLDLHQRVLGLVAGLVGDDVPVGVHDVADGGLALCLAELAVRSSIGFRVEGVDGPAELFGEAPSRVVLCVPDAGAERSVVARAREAGVPARRLGRAGGDRLVVDGLIDIGLDEAVAAWQGAIPRALAG
jgi:phosphoribosylformylglycinamidine synthase